MVNPFTFGQFTLYAGRSSYTIQSVHVENYFSELRDDIIAAYYGFYFMEYAMYFTKEANDEREMLKLLYQTLKALTNPNIPNRLIRYVFELKALCINGQAPQVFQCTCCGSTGRSMVFSPRKGGLVCTECDGDVIDGMRLNNSTLYTLQYVENSKIEHLYTFIVKENVLDELGRLMERYNDLYVDKRFKSLEILETLL